MSERDDVVEVEGTVEESLPNATFRVHLDSAQIILAHLSGKMRMNYIKILPGDRVSIELSVYDLSKGRIVRRLPVVRPGSLPVPPLTTDAQTPSEDIKNDGAEATTHATDSVENAPKDEAVEQKAEATKPE